jgi:SAM-dependent methyltransferase
MTASRSADHFERIYRSNPDPWSFTSPYEQAKYRHTLSVLGDRRFTSGLEVGCSIGVLTRMLAPRCGRLLALDIVDTPLNTARSRCADQPQVRFEQMQVPGAWPDQPFDLIVLSEVLYFLTPADIDHCANRVIATLLPNAVVILVNWLGQSDDPTTGDDAAERFIDVTSNVLSIGQQARTQGYRLDVLHAQAKG